MAKSNFKPNKGLQKRVKVTGNGRFKARHAGMGHLLSVKPGSRRRQLRQAMVVAKAEEKRLRKMMGL